MILPSIANEGEEKEGGETFDNQTDAKDDEVASAQNDNLKGIAENLYIVYIAIHSLFLKFVSQDYVIFLLRKSRFAKSKRIDFFTGFWF